MPAEKKVRGQPRDRLLFFLLGLLPSLLAFRWIQGSFAFRSLLLVVATVLYSFSSLAAVSAASDNTTD